MMIQIEDKIVSLDVLEQFFCCDLAACKGCCCVEGDAGAPVAMDEIAQLEAVVPIVWDRLSDKAKKVIDEYGPVYVDADGEFVTSIVDGKDCVFTCYDADGTCLCAIEQAFRAGETDFSKPVSCHLYPIRLKKYDTFTAVNYHKWFLCEAAAPCGKKRGIKVYQFLKEPLIRKFGQVWYNNLCVVAAEWEKSVK
ncbi:hypothetical protein AGMMS4957_05850 [Bacteroidia bacterium]|nr:hypothetical protein AGMMS4957_05850 [Bacteroidia bacterium]